MLLLLARFILVLVVLGLIIGLIYYIVKTDNAPPPALVRNYEKRFDPQSNKYYLVNVLPTKEVPVCTWYGKRILYKDMIKAEYVLEKLNETK